MLRGWFVVAGLEACGRSGDAAAPSEGIQRAEYTRRLRADRCSPRLKAPAQGFKRQRASQPFRGSRVEKAMTKAMLSAGTASTLRRMDVHSKVRKTAGQRAWTYCDALPAR